MQKSVTKVDTDWTDRDSENQACFSCRRVRKKKKNVISLRVTHFESYTWNTGEARTIHTQLPFHKDRIEQWMTKMGKMIVGAQAAKQLLVVFGHWSDHWGGTF